MKKIEFFLSFLFVFLASTSPGLADGGGSAAKSPAPEHFASGVKKIAYDAPKDLVKETVEEIPKKPPIVSVVEGVNRGTQKFIDHTIKGAYRVATLGTSELESYEVEEPKKGSDEPTKFKISLPGT